MNPGFVFAQSNADFEAPLIEHERIEKGVLGDTQVFTANVVDNIELQNVFLFYRFSGEEEFKKLAMDRIATSSFYSSNVETSDIAMPADGVLALEYYIQAEDTAGNIVLKGYIFDPLVRDLSDSGSKIAKSPDSNTGTEPVVRKKSNVLWYALGAVGVIAIGAALADRDDPKRPEGCENDSCQITVEVGTPTASFSF